MDKTAIDQSTEEEQTSKPSVGSSTVLNILKRFRSRREVTEDREPPFNDRLGAASGPLAERISEISNLIEAGRSKDPKASKSPADSDGENASDAPKDAGADAAEATEAKADDETEARQKPRVRSMGFHNPVFPAKSPDAPKDPDFVASTEPPPLRLHDAPDGVMENSGAPEKLVTPPKQKPLEPLDLKVFAEHVRANLPKPEPKMPPVDQSADGNAETDADAAAFKQQFYARISKASQVSAFGPFSATEEPNILRMPASLGNLEARDATASAALQSWRKFQSPGDQKTDHEEPERSETPLHAVETEDSKGEAEAAEETPEEDLATPDIEASTAGKELHQFDHPPFEPPVDGTEVAAQQDELAEEPREDIPEPAVEPEPEEAVHLEEPYLEETVHLEESGLEETVHLEEPEVTVHLEEPKHDMPSDVEPPAPETENDPIRAGGGQPEDTIQIDPDNVFAALNIDEEELLTRVYDVIQDELEAAWGENITLNIRKIVREEVRAALERSRSDG